MRRGALGAVILAMALVGCSSPELQTTGVDVARAFNAARDRWAAPESISFPSQQYGGSNVLRDAGSRSTDYPGLSARRIARLEIDAALEAGWTLASVACADRQHFTAELAKGADLDDAALALVEVDAHSASVRLSVPHHLDGSWPSTMPADVEESCLAGGPNSEPPTTLPFDPYPGDGGSAPLEDYEPWQRDTLSDAETELGERVLADPFLAEIGAKLAVPALRTGDNWRSSFGSRAVAQATGSSTRESLADVLRRSGWAATWVSCGNGLPASATARLPVENKTVVARLTSTTPGSVEVQVVIGVPEAPLSWPAIDDVPVLEDSRCLGNGELGPGLTLEGTPVALPGQLHPYLGG